MKITFLVDNLNSWVVPYAKNLQRTLRALGHDIKFISDHAKIPGGDLLLLLSCEKILKTSIFSRNNYNLVYHASDLPKGKGMSPLTWQVLENKKCITVSLFEASENLDEGPIYFKSKITFKGDELIDEMRERLMQEYEELLLKFIKFVPNVKANSQKGQSSFYQKRTSTDSELDIHKSIKEQFNLLRVVDNEKYPAYFRYKGQKYILRIEKDE